MEQNMVTITDKKQLSYECFSNFRKLVKLAFILTVMEGRQKDLALTSSGCL